MIIEVYKNAKPKDKSYPWRVRIDGKEDPRNRDFHNRVDILDSFKTLNLEGYYIGATIVFPPLQGEAQGERIDLDSFDIKTLELK